MTTPPQTQDSASVTALLVSHDGVRWLPAVLDALAAQTRPADCVLAVDTGSTDGSAELIAERLGGDRLVTAPERTPFGRAVAEGLAALPPVADDGWVWLLHDDAAPAPDALEALLAAAADNPSAEILGPKLREWPSLRRLLEVGVTISGTGRRETGLERGEYDQGQHDRLQDVLAVNTAGMLVRRSVLEQLGFDDRLPVFGNDVDFGWRAARAGHRTLVVPDAVVFHVEAAHRGVRRTPLTGRHFRRGQRQAALYTLLVNTSGRWLPFLWLRLLLGSLVRTLGFLLVRSPGEARDELSALARVYARPGRILGGRRRRRRAATVGHGDVRHLLAPPWLPYRHGLDFLSDLALALTNQATDMTAARRARTARAVEASETGPVPAEAQNLPEDTGLVARLLRSPLAGLVLLTLVVSVVANRGLLGGGSLAGGALLPAPDSAFDWWRTYLASGHDLGTGSAAPAAPYLLPLALLGTLALGKASLAVDLLFLLAVPLALLGAHRTMRRIVRSRGAALWAALAYSLLPVLTGAVQEGRLGSVVAAVVLPWLVHSALFLAPWHSADRRWRAAWRTSLWLALLTAFVPLAWLLALPLTVLAFGAGRRGAAVSASWLPVVTPLLVSLVLLLPWTVATWAHQGPQSWLFEAGLPAASLTTPLTWSDVLFARPGGSAPWWLSAGLVAAAVAALARPDTRRQVLRCWWVIVVALVVTVPLAVTSHHLASAVQPQPLWLGFPLLVASAAAICAAAVAGSGIRERLSGANFGWRQPVGAAVVLVALVTPVVGLVWWGLAGTDGPLGRREANPVPTYMTDTAATDPARGVLVVSGGARDGFSHVLLRGPGLRTGDDTVLPRVEEQQELTDLVARLVSAPEPEDVEALGALGIGFVYASPPADIRLVGNLDSLSGITPGSALLPGSRAWQVDVEATSAPAVPTSAARPWLLALQLVALLVVAVLAAPTRKVTR